MSEKKILIVDDELGARESLKIILKGSKYDLLMAASGKEALAAIDSKILPDVILLDLKMPDMCGFDVLVAVKRKYPSIEVIMLTGHGAASGGVDSMEKGAFAFIMKPVDFGELQKKIKQAYQKRVSGS